MMSKQAYVKTYRLFRTRNNQGTFTPKLPNMLGTQEKGGAVSRSPR